jgi:hypothetical protein
MSAQFKVITGYDSDPETYQQALSQAEDEGWEVRGFSVTSITGGNKLSRGGGRVFVALLRKGS